MDRRNCSSPGDKEMKARMKISVVMDYKVNILLDKDFIITSGLCYYLLSSKLFGGENWLAMKHKCCNVNKGFFL